MQKFIIGIGFPVAVIGLVALAEVFPRVTHEGYAPAQPIPFSHKKHAGDNGISCLYCHSGAERSRHATIPALNVCMNCHSVVKTDSPLIQQVQKAYEEKKPIEWVRVYELPDHVFFPHYKHVQANVSCETCHGDVKSMARIEQVAPLNMGWCLDCHRGRTAPLNVLEAKYPDQKNPHGDVAARDCILCHR